MLDEKALFTFLSEVDKDFVDTISAKADLKELASKYIMNGTLCFEEQNGQCVALVAGYTKNTLHKMGYISLVAAKKSVRNQGICSRLVFEFLEIAKSEGLDAVHVYTHKTNKCALAMYHKTGFVEYVEDNSSQILEHLICYLNDYREES